MAALIELSVQQAVARLTLNRPDKRNALTRDMLGELLALLPVIAGDSSVRCVLVSGQGPWFCAGMDLVQMQETAARPDAAEVWQEDTRLYLEAVKGLFDLPMPTLAVVRGGAVAGGLGLMLACDLVLATDSATFALPEPKRGITAAVVTPLLVHRAGTGAAGFLLLAGEAWTAQQAQQYGLCHRVVSEQDLEAAANRLAQSILTGAPGALAITKKQLRNCVPGDLSDQLSRAAVVSAEARGTPEAREGLAAFLAKRPPAWQRG